MIQLSNKFRLRADSKNIILDKKYVTKEGKEAWKEESFHSSLESAIKKACYQNLLDEFDDLKKVYDLNKEIQEEVKRLNARIGVSAF